MEVYDPASLFRRGARPPSAPRGVPPEAPTLFGPGTSSPSSSVPSARSATSWGKMRGGVSAEIVACSREGPGCWDIPKETTKDCIPSFPAEHQQVFEGTWSLLLTREKGGYPQRGHAHPCFVMDLQGHQKEDRLAILGVPLKKTITYIYDSPTRCRGTLWQSLWHGWPLRVSNHNVRFVHWVRSILSLYYLNTPFTPPCELDKVRVTRY